MSTTTIENNQICVSIEEFSVTITLLPPESCKRNDEPTDHQETPRERTARNLELAMIDVRNAVDAQGLKIRLVDVHDRRAIADKFEALSEALIVAMDDTCGSTDFKRGRVTVAAHVKLLAGLQEAYWLHDNAVQGIF